MYVDIHTHSLTHDPRILEVHVLDPRTPAELSIPGSTRFCFGLHPWYVEEVEEKQFFTELKTCMQHQGFFALGEIGIDRAKPDTLETQTSMFKKQLEYVSKFRLERVVVHCVRAYSDVLPELKKLSSATSVIMHDFNGNPETYEQFSRLENCYFSFGAKLFKPETKAYKTFQKIDLSRTFLETDDQLDKSILDIYEQAAQIRKIPPQELKDTLYQNYRRLAHLD